MTYDRRDIRGGAVQTTLNGGITNSSPSCVITSATGWPDGGTNPAFYVVIDPGLATEEKVLCSTRSSTTVNFTTRGVDGTSAAAHSSGAAIYPCITAVDLDEANLAVAKLLKLATAVGQVPVVDAANSFAMVQAKTSGQILVGNGTTVASVAVSGDATLASTGAVTISANAVTNAKAAAMTRGTTKVGNAAGAASDLAIGAANTVLATDGTDPSWRKIVSADITDGTIATADVAAAAITSPKLGIAKVRLRRAAAQSVAGVTTAAISWDTEDADASGYITATSSTLTVPSGLDGFHLITARILAGTAWAGGNGHIIIVAGGLTYLGGISGADTVEPSGCMTVLAYLAATNTIVVSVINGSGSSQNFFGNLSVANLGA